MTYTLSYIHLSHGPWSRKDILLFLYAMLKYLWTGIIFTPVFLKSLQRRLAFIDINKDHSQSGISEWKKIKKFTFLCHHVWTMCEHYCVNMHLWISSLNALYPACPCTMQVYLYLHVIYCHLHITMCNHVWTMCEHLCEHASANCFLKHIWPFMSIYNSCLSTFTCTTLPLANHHVSPSVNNVWTLLCEHASVNIFFNHIVPCMCMYMYCTVTWILTCVSICYHVAKCVNVLTCMYACMSMYIMTVCLIIKELVTKVKVSRSQCMYTCVLILP